MIFVDGSVFVTMLEYSDFVSSSYNLIILFSYFCQKRIKQFKKIDMVWSIKTDQSWLNYVKFISHKSNEPDKL